MHFSVPLLHKKVQKFAADLGAGQHEELILNERRSSAFAHSWISTASFFNNAGPVGDSAAFHC